MSTIERINEFPSKANRTDHFVISGNENFAFAVGKEIFVNKINSGNLTDHVVLRGHHSNVTALCLKTYGSSEYLLSAGSFYVILWDIREVWESYHSNDDVRGKIILKMEDCAPVNITLSDQLERACLHDSNTVSVCNINSKVLIWSKCGGKFTNAVFLSEVTVVVAINSCIIEVWEHEQNFLIWKSNILQHEIVHLYRARPTSFVVGCSNNSIIVYNASENEKTSTFRRKFMIDLDMEMFRYNSKTNDEPSANSHLIAIHPFQKFSDEGGDREVVVENFVMCATSQAIFIANSSTQEVEVLPFSTFDIDLMSEVSFAQAMNSTVLCVAAPLFKQNIEILQINAASRQDSIETVTVIPRVPLIDTSILKRTLIPSKIPSKKLGKVKHHPVTFKEKIRSSGYNKAPENRKMFQPVTSIKSKPSEKTKKTGKLELLSENKVTCDWGQPLEITASIPTCDRPSNVNHISLSECNRYIGCSLQNCSSVIFGRKTKKHIATLGEHDGPIAGTSWSYDSTLIMTCSHDCSAKLWSISNSDAPVMNLLFRNGSLAKNPEKIAKEISHGQFYYMDKFLILCFGNSFGLYSYYIDNGPRNDVKRYLEKNKYRLVKLFDLSGAKSITCFSAPNNIYSYITLACGSDKTLHVFDMNVGKSAGKIQSIHTRPASHLVINTGSTFSQPSSYDLFATAAPADGVKLWDLRSSKCISKFKSHPDTGNNPVDISPCGNYLATSGDDKRVHIYDIRKTCLLQSEIQQNDKISSLRFTKDGSDLLLGLRNCDLITASVT